MSLVVPAMSLTIDLSVPREGVEGKRGEWRDRGLWRGWLEGEGKELGGDDGRQSGQLKGVEMLSICR